MVGVKVLPPGPVPPDPLPHGGAPQLEFSELARAVVALDLRVAGLRQPGREQPHRRALLVGQLESFSSFWASAFKEVLVFTLIIPVLWWRSMRSVHVEEDEE